MARRIELSRGRGRPPRVVWAPCRSDRGASARLAPRLWAAALAIGAAVDRVAGWPVSHCRPGRSPVSAAAVHAGAAWVWSADIADAYPSVRYGQLSAAVGGALAHVTASAARDAGADCAVPQGLPHAPAAYEAAAAAALDRPVVDALVASGLAARGVRYTRYADDLTISARSRADLDCAAQIVRDAIDAAVWRAAPHKTEVTRVAGDARAVVCGVSVGAGAGVAAPRATRRRARAAAHGAVMALRDAAALAAVAPAWSTALIVVAAARLHGAAGLAEWCAVRAPSPAVAAARLAARGADWIAAARECARSMV